MTKKLKPFGVYSVLIPFDTPNNYTSRIITHIGTPAHPFLKETMGLAINSGKHIKKEFRMPYALWYDNRYWTELKAMRWWDDNKNKVKFVK